jgi:hypothetical protein
MRNGPQCLDVSLTQQFSDAHGVSCTPAATSATLPATTTSTTPTTAAASAATTTALE